MSVFRRADQAMASDTCGCGEAGGCLSICCPCYLRGTSCTHSCACSGACYSSDFISRRPAEDVPTGNAPRPAPEAVLALGHAMGRQFATLQHTWDRQMTAQPWQSGLQQAGTLQYASPCVSRDSPVVIGRPSRVVWAPPVQPAAASAAHPPAAPFISIGQHHQQSLPLPQGGRPQQQAAPDAASERSLSGGGPSPAQRGHAAAEPSQLAANDAEMRPQAAHTPEQLDMSSGVEFSVPSMGAEGSPAHGTPNLDLLSSIDTLVQQQALPEPGAAALSASDPGQSASILGPPSMWSAAGMEPATPQMCASSERPWWHLSPVSSAREELPVSDAPAELLQPDIGDIEDSPGFSETVEAPPQHTSSPAPAKKKARRARILRDGQLTMIVYGDDEALKWQLRIGKFFGVIRGVLGRRGRVEGQWGGSILDSVVGVFLTQNVSDALSSKAWMNLAATFPLPAYKQDSLDSIDWEAVRTAPVEKVADAIKCRGMQNKLAAGIQALLNNIREYGRDLPKKQKKKAEAKAAPAPDVAADAALAGGGSGNNRQASRGPDSASTESRTSQLTERIQDLLASLIREPLAHEVDQCQQPSPDSIEPETPRLREAAPKLGRTRSPGCPSPVPEPGQARSPSCSDSSVPAHQLSAGDLASGSNPTESWHDPAGQLPSGKLSGRRSSGAQKSYFTAEATLTSSTSSRSQTAACRSDASTRDPDISSKDVGSLSSVMTEAEREIWEGAADSDLEDLSDTEGSADEDGIQHEYVSAPEEHMRTPTSEQRPVQVQLSIQHGQPGTEPRWPHVCVRLYVTECLGGVRYVAPDGSAEPVQEGGCPGDYPLDLEWLRQVHVEQARRYLMDVAGLGRKSVACVLLLALGRKEFPVDVNVARICARLGWIPLDSEQAIEEMDAYAPEKEVHEYLRSRLMHFDVETLYELHYLMITLGKVFCTKRNPNCMACPLRHECDYALANGQHLQPGRVRPKKATPRPRKPASRANAMLALPSGDSASAGGGDSEVAQQLSADRLQSQVQQLLTGLAKAKSGPDASIQQTAEDHASSQQASAAQAGNEGTSVEQNATRLPQPLPVAEFSQGGLNSSAQGAASSQQVAAAPASAAAEAMSAEGVAQLPVPLAAALPPGWTVLHSQINPGRHAAATPFQLPPPRLPAHAQVPPAGRPGSSESLYNVGDAPVQQAACLIIPAGLPQPIADQDGRVVTADLACREGLSPSVDTHSIDVGGLSCLQPLQQAAEASAAGASRTAETASVDIVGSCALVHAPALAAERPPGSISCAGTASISIIGSAVHRALPQSADEDEPAESDPVQAVSTGCNSAGVQDAAPACPPSEASGERINGATAQQQKQAAKREAGQPSAAACIGKRPRDEQEGAPGKQLKLLRTLRELDVDPSSSLTLSASDWLPPQPGKTWQQALNGQQLRKLRGRQIPVPGVAAAAAGSEGHAGSRLVAASSPPPGIAPAEHEQHAQAYNASAGAQDTAEAAAEHTSGDGEAAQQQSISEAEASEPAAPICQSSVQPAQPAEESAPPHAEPCKGSRELYSLLSSALATPGQQASSVPLCRQLTGKTRAQSAPQPEASNAPANKRKKASTGELAKLLEAAAKVAPRDASSAPLHLQAHGRTRAQSTPKRSASDELFSPRKDRKPNRELARLLHAAADVPPKDASSAPLYLGATRRANAGSQQKPSLEVNAPAPVQAQAEAPSRPKPMPKSMRGFRELAALHDGLLVQAPSQPRRRHAVKLEQAETAGQGPLPTALVPAGAEQANKAKRKPSGGRERRWAASGQPIGQLGRRAAQTRRAGQLAAVQSGGIAKRTRQRDLSLAGPATMASSGQQTSSKPHVKQTARKQTGNPALIAQASPVKLTARKASRASAKAVRASAAAPSKVHKGIARVAARGPHMHGGTAEGQGSVTSQGAGDPKEPNEAAARRSKRTAAGGRLRQVLKRVKNPIQAAKAELMQSRAARVNLLRQKVPGRPAQPQQPLRPLPQEEGQSPSSGTACNWGGSQRPRREASLGVQRLVEAYKLPWNIPESSAGKRPHHSVGSAWPHKKARSDPLPGRAKAQHRSAAVGSRPGWGTETAAQLLGHSIPSMEQGSGVPAVQAPGSPAMPGWSLPAPQVDPHRLLRPQQAFTVVRPSEPEPLPRHLGAIAFKHAAYVASRGGTAAPRVAAADGAWSPQEERLGVIQRARSQRAARASMPSRPGQQAPVPGQPMAPKHMRQTAGPARGMHVPAHARSQPAGDRPHSKTARAGQPSALPQAGAPGGGCKAAQPETDAISPQGKVLLGVLERGRDLAKFQAPQGDAAGSCNQIPDRVLEAAASVLQLGSAEAHNMAALSFDNLLQSWGRGAIRKRFHELSMQVHPDKCGLPDADQAFALLVRAQQMLIARLTRSEQGGRAPDEAPADEAGPDTIPEQHLVKVLQAYEVPQASAHALLGVDYSSTLQALDTPLLVLPMPEDTLQSQHAAAATPEPSCVFSSPSAAQSHDSPPSHEVPSRQVSASQPGKRKQPDALCQLYAAPGPIAEQLSAALAQTEQAGSGRPLATQQHPAAANQRSQAKEEGRPGMGGGSRIRCVLLVPCCEAVHGRFPLNGTYFQINEVFLDAATLQHPVMVPAAEMHAWKQHSVYFGSTVVSVCRGMTTRQVAAFFDHGILCVRSYYPSTGAPHDLPDWARPGNGAAKQADGLPRKRQKAAAAAVTFPELAALPPPLTHGPSQLSATGQPKLPGVMAKRPYKKRQPIASTSLQAHLAASRLSSGLHAEATKSGHVRQRRVLFPSIPKSEACGQCINCLNPSRKQACLVRRQKMLAELEKQQAPAEQRMEPDAAAELQVFGP